MRDILLAIQCSTYIALGVLLIQEGQVKLGVSQLLLAFVQGLIYL